MTDTSLNSTCRSMTVGVDGTGGGETLVLSQTGTIADTGSRQTIRCGSFAVPGGARLTFRVTATPNVRLAQMNLTRYDAAVWTIRFNGQAVQLTPVCNPPGSDPAVAVSAWDSPAPGQVDFDLLGPAVFNSWGEYAGHRTQNYELEVLLVPGPIVTTVNPGQGSVAGHETVRINGTGFGQNPIVLFDEVAAQDVVRVSSTELNCSTPPGLPGETTVTVLNSDAEGQPWNYGPPYALFGRLTNGFTFTAPTSPLVRGTERLLGTYGGYFPAVGDGESQRQENHEFSLPGAGRVRFEAWAFVPILNPIPGPFDNPDDLAYHNETTAVKGFAGHDGSSYVTTLDTSDITNPFSPVISEATSFVDARSAGTSRFTVTGPARWNAFWREFGEFEMLSAPAQTWRLAVWFAPPPARSCSARRFHSGVLPSSGVSVRCVHRRQFFP